MESKLLNAMRAYFGEDLKRITHAEQVLGFAKQIMRVEGGVERIIIPTAILHDIGIKECERKYGSSAGDLQEKEGPAIARNILEKFDFTDQEIAEICEIIGSHHTRGKIDTLNFKIIWDADCLVNLNDQLQIKEMVDKIFFTNTAKKIFLGGMENATKFS